MALPESFGFMLCRRCLCLRRADGVRQVGEVVVRGITSVWWECIDPAVCSRLAGVGDGSLDADTGQVTP